MAEALTAALAAGYRLLARLWQVKVVCGKRNSNQGVLQELSLFIKDLDRSLAVLQEKRPRNTSSILAADLLKDHYQLASDYLDKCLKLGNFKTLWDTSTIQQKLSRIRDGIATSLETCLQHLELDVALTGPEEVEDFRQTLLPKHKKSMAALEELCAGLTGVSSSVRNLSQAVAYMRQEARSERQAMLKLLVIATEKRRDSPAELLPAIAELRSTQVQTMEFFADVLQILEQFAGSSSLQVVSTAAAAPEADQHHHQQQALPLPVALISGGSGGPSSRELAVSTNRDRRITQFNSDGTAKWNPAAAARLVTFSDDRTGMSVNSSCAVEVFASANWCSPRVFNGFPGYYFEVQVKAGDDVAVGFDVLRNHGKVQPYLVLPRPGGPGEDLVGCVQYRTLPRGFERVNVSAVGVSGQLWCFFEPANLAADGEVYGDPQALEAVQRGDALGVGVNFENREVFFTRNGELTWLVSDVSMDWEQAWVPACWVYPPGGGEVEANFGARGPNTFVFPLETLFKPDLRNAIVGRRVDVIHYQEVDAEEQRGGAAAGGAGDRIDEMGREETLVELGRTLASRQWHPNPDTTAVCTYRRVLLGKFEVPFSGSSGRFKPLRSAAPPLPTRFLSSERKDLTVYSPDRLTVKVVTGGLLHGNRVCPAQLQGLPGYYFEVLFRTGLQKTSLVGVSLFIKTAQGKTDGVVGVVFDGHTARLWGNGNKPSTVTGQMRRIPSGGSATNLAAAAADSSSIGPVTLGCGINLERREIFFTRNGTVACLLANVSLLQDITATPPHLSRLMPMCRASAAGGEVRVNFGHQVPFLFSSLPDTFDPRWWSSLDMVAAAFPLVKSAQFTFAA